MIDLESTRLHLRELTEDDLPNVLTVYTSNPKLVQRQEGSEGEVGKYDLERWQRDWYIAQLMPGRHMLGCYLKAHDEAVGYIDFIEEDDDGYPRLGQLIIHKNHQRQGLATEAFQRLVEHFRRGHSWPLLRAWALKQDEIALSFLRHVGFRAIEQERRQGRSPAGVQDYIILERTLGE